MIIESDIKHVDDILRTWRNKNHLVALVPTMGNLHAGHLSLVKYAKEQADKVVVSIYINPTQFGLNEDLKSYPRTLKDDIKKLNALACDLVFIPDDHVMYPEGIDDLVEISFPGIDNVLCGASREGHFNGVARVIMKLFNMIRPDVAIFGEKDYQQLVIIKKLVSAFCFPLTIISMPTVRDTNGLALSSRNSYLSIQQKKTAANIYKTIKNIPNLYNNKDSLTIQQFEKKMRNRLIAYGMNVEYAELRSAADLSRAMEDTDFLGFFVAVRIEQIRLIDNIIFAK